MDDTTTDCHINSDKLPDQCWGSRGDLPYLHYEAGRIVYIVAINIPEPPGIAMTVAKEVVKDILCGMHSYNWLALEPQLAWNDYDPLPVEVIM
jgi:hypothetical protein